MNKRSGLPAPGTFAAPQQLRRPSTKDGPPPPAPGILAKLRSGILPPKAPPAVNPRMVARIAPPQLPRSFSLPVVPTEEPPTPTRRSSVTEFIAGERVRVDSMGLEGTLRYVGGINVKPGIWAGIEMDTPGTGKNDGSVGGYSIQLTSERNTSLVHQSQAFSSW